MKKSIAIVLALIMIFALCACGKTETPAPTEAPAPAATEASSSAEEPAPVEKEPEIEKELVLYSTLTEEQIEAMIKPFNELYPDVAVETVSGTAGELTARLTAEKDSPKADIMWGGLSDSDGDMYADVFDTYVSSHDGELMEGYSSNNGMYNFDGLSTVCFCVNEELEKELGITINSYEDLLNPALEGKILLADPNSSSSAWNNLCNIMSVFGVDSEEAWAYIEKLMPNLIITSSSSACFNSVYDGEYVVGMTYENGVAVLLNNGAEGIRMVFPAEGTSAMASGGAVVKGAAHPNAAKAFVEVAMSAEGQTKESAILGGAAARYTNLGYTGPDNWILPATEEIKWVVRPVAELTAQKSASLEHWKTIYASVNG